VNRTLIVPEFDPELQPIGYTLVGANAGRGHAASDRFGWEFDTAA
jgi:hypothetical protein